MNRYYKKAKTDAIKKPVKPLVTPTPTSNVIKPVKTGDYTNIWVYIVLLAVAGIAIAAGFVYKKKQKK